NVLRLASGVGREREVRLLIEYGADVNEQGGFYGTALQVASINGHKEIMKLLLENEADVNAVDGYHGTALHAASQGRRQNVVQLLLDNGTYLFSRFFYSRTYSWRQNKTRW
ncbi:ankyrin repeat-containing domain protein, partial [Mycena crocata]